MKNFIRTITVFLAATLMLAVPSSCQSTAENQTQDSQAAASTPQQAEVAQTQAEELQTEVGATQEALKQTNYLLQTTAAGLEAAGENLSVSAQWPFHASQTVLVIPADELNPEDLSSISEDLGIMHRIFNKQLRQECGVDPAFTSLFGGYNNNELLYLDGYGALFLLQVDVPLAPPLETKEQEPNEQGDQTWEQTRHELYSTGEDMTRTRVGTFYSLRGPDRPSEKYDPAKVEQLKNTIINSLKHATNIRNLKPEESVIVTIRGCAPAGTLVETRSSSVAPPKSTSRPTVSSNKKRTELVQTLVLTKETRGAATIMTIRAKKSDIDAFAKGKADLDQFRRKVRINTYTAGGPDTVIQPVQPSQF